MQVKDGDLVQLLPTLELATPEPSAEPGSPMLARSAAAVFDLGKVPAALVESLVALTTEPIRVDALCERLALRFSRELVVAVLTAYEGLLVSVDRRHPHPSRRDLAVAVVGSGRIARELAGVLQQSGCPDVRSSPFATGEALDAPIVVLAPEDTPLLDVVAGADALAGRAVILVLVQPGHVQVGPTIVAGATACPACAIATAVLGGGGATVSDTDEVRALLGRFRTGALGARASDAVLAAGAVQCALAEIEALAVEPAEPRLLVSATCVDGLGRRRDVTVNPSPDCQHCNGAVVGGAPVPKAVDNEVVGDEVAAAEVVIANRRALASIGSRRQPELGRIRTVGVIGGGTAGFLTALALRARLPQLEVTVIESSTIPVVGVGEATTPRLVRFLHGDEGLRRDIVDFHERVRPTWKLGVMYDWGEPSRDPFPWPFQYGDLIDSWHHEGDLRLHCLGAELMHRCRSPLVARADGAPVSLLTEVPFAYHLDNPRFVRYLHDEARRDGVQLRDEVVVDIEVRDVSPEPEVAALVTERGARLSFDLYVDCTGFRSMLLGKALRVPFVSYASSLFTDSAVMADVPHDGSVKPYTLAESMHHGWCWNIPFEDADHRGYVFSSAFASPEEAAAEMRSRNVGMGDWWSLRFRSGRHDRWWTGNVVGLGNAYAFVEPLASTALHMLVSGIDLLTAAIPSAPGPVARRRVSAQFGAAWDEIRAWLAVQYWLNRRHDTPFWRECAQHVELAGAEERLARFQEQAPIATASGVESTYFAEDYSYDIMFAGNRVPSTWVPPQRSVEGWRVYAGRLRGVAGRALEHAEALRLVRTDRRDLLVDLVERGDSWLQRMAV